mmetsp:Transcript_7442/g.13130  ORF Transcript_7442/g.13130 Transcript_7442/m.13130 type:complete len:282 (+) Transcript_7442:100-945(+)
MSYNNLVTRLSMSTSSRNVTGKDDFITLAFPAERFIVSLPTIAVLGMMILAPVLSSCTVVLLHPIFKTRPLLDPVVISSPTAKGCVTSRSSPATTLPTTDWEARPMAILPMPPNVSTVSGETPMNANHALMTNHTTPIDRTRSKMTGSPRPCTRESQYLWSALSALWSWARCCISLGGALAFHRNHPKRVMSAAWVRPLEKAIKEFWIMSAVTMWSFPCERKSKTSGRESTNPSGVALTRRFKPRNIITACTAWPKGSVMDMMTCRRDMAGTRSAMDCTAA